MKNEQTLAMAARLREFHQANERERFGRTLMRWIEDPIQPRTKQGKFRINPILVLLAVMVTLASGTCLFFTLVQP